MNGLNKFEQSKALLLKGLEKAGFIYPPKEKIKDVTFTIEEGDIALIQFHYSTTKETYRLEEWIHSHGSSRLTKATRIEV